MEPSIRVSVRRAPCLVQVTVDGELDLLTGPVLRASLEPVVAEAPALLVLDLGGVRFIDAAGLRPVLVQALALSAAGGQLVLSRPSPMLQRMLAVLGLEPVLPVRER